MKISPTTHKIIKEAAVPITCGMIGLVSMALWVSDQRGIDYAKNQQVKEYVKQHNPELYNEYSRTDRPIKDYYEAARDIREDLRLDSVAKTNYALGMQAVRDSLANANKK